MKKNYQIDGLDCPNCAAKIERAVAGLDGVEEAVVDFMARKLFLTAPDDRFDDTVRRAQELISKIEPGVVLLPPGARPGTAGHPHHHDHEHHHHDHEHDHGHGHEHHHEHTGQDGGHTGHDHSHGGGEPHEQRRQLVRILASGVLFAAVSLLSIEGTPRLLAFLAVYLLIGWDILWRAVQNILHGEVFDENFLMAVATVGAFLIGEYPEGVAVMLFYQTGELFQSYAVNRSRRSIGALMDIRPDSANLIRGETTVVVGPEEVRPGERILVRPGERVPLDGVVCGGESRLDTSALTGESVPRGAGTGDTVLSGSINLSGALTIEVTKEYGESTVAKILELVENASSKKSAAENYITKFARWYTPSVVGVAVLLALLPPLLLSAPFSVWLYRALVFLVISCPCALVISIPLSFFGGIGGASRCGILIKGSNYLEALSQTEIVVFDKTGTLTRGSFAVTSVNPAAGTEPERLLELAALAEGNSTHPIAQSLQKAVSAPANLSRVGAYEEIAGHGVRAEIDGAAVLAGNARLMEQERILYQPCGAAGTVVYLARNGEFLGSIVISDEVKPDAARAVKELRGARVRKTVMLTGDAKEVGEAVANQLGLDEVRTQLLPGDKVAEVERLLAERSERGKLVFVGDGINDAPVLARADIGVAMGGAGSDAAIEAADVVIMTDEPSKLADAVRLSRRTLSIVRQNIAFALGVKLLVLLLGAAGFASMWAAVFADVGVSVIAILNAVRVLNVKQFQH